MNSWSYCERILALINHKMQVKPHLTLMQDNAPCHKANNTIIELNQLNISSIHWPALLSDLNPIESEWNIMKDYTAIGMKTSFLIFKLTQLYDVCR